MATGRQPENAGRRRHDLSGTCRYNRRFPNRRPLRTMSRKTAPKTFEEALSRLETLTQTLQSSSLPLEEALAAYQEGTQLVRFCQGKLAEAEQKLAVLDNNELKEFHLDGE